MYGIYRPFCLTSPASLLTQCLLCKIPLWYFLLLRSSLCLSLLWDTRMLNSSLCLNRSGDAASKCSKTFCHSEVPSLDLFGDISIGNGNYLLIDTTYRAMAVPYTGPVFQAYITKKTPCNHWWRLTLSAEFIFCNLFKYLQNPSFIIVLWFTLATECTGIIKFSWKFLLKIPSKIPSASTTIIFGSPNGTKKFSKSHCVAWIIWQNLG